MILVLYAHPYPRHSRACAALAAALEGRADVELRSLYDRYPDFDIDAEAERAALVPARLVAWLHPFYWYHAPALMQLWFERVLTKGWAYGPGGTALEGKDCLWITTTGGDEASYTARFCGMNWLEPFVVHGAHIVDDASLRASCSRLAARLAPYAQAGKAK